jgi:hypothetical protein
VKVNQQGLVRALVLALVVGALWVSGSAGAHITLLDPQPRTESQKVGPCGLANDPKPDAPVAVFEPGQTITVRWTETINHPGHFRISFDPDGQDDFVDPASFDDFNSAPSVLLDNIADTPSGGVSEVEVTLPTVTCERCTLQVVQVMTDKPPYGDGNDLYYQCADIALRASGGDAVSASDVDNVSDASGANDANSVSDAGDSAQSTSAGDDEGACGCNVYRRKQTHAQHGMLWGVVLACAGVAVSWRRVISSREKEQTT